MTSLPAVLDGPQLKYLGTAVFMLGVSYTIIKWVGRTLRDQIGPGMNRTGATLFSSPAETAPPALIREALDRGLVTSAQLAEMPAMERQFLFATLQHKLSIESHPQASGAGAASARSAVRPQAIAGAEFGLAAVPANEILRVFCPSCGGPLTLPAFPPYIAHCDHCGAKAALREEDGGRYVLIVTPRKAAS
jgi:hypothetical protein